MPDSHTPTAQASASARVPWLRSVVLLLIGATIGIGVSVAAYRIWLVGPNPESAQDSMVEAEITLLEARRLRLRDEHTQLAREAEAQISRIRYSSGGADAIQGALESLFDMEEAAKRKTRSQEILSELVSLQKRINELSGME